MESLALLFMPMVDSLHSVLVSMKVSYETRQQRTFDTDCGRVRPKRKCMDKCREVCMVFSRFHDGVHEHRVSGSCNYAHGPPFTAKFAASKAEEPISIEEITKST